ncbi:carboxymuconolactone decarboxylase family protein [Halomonas coralii]|uniref:carboxymuconolactone decarboxylase family protein n=1 Tax=Modicisalibacter sp. R2A 31.J TaxID=2831898 RepID=UPI001CCDFCED|nr:carboxymuconolactone decarboxylase family protein [Modicisalibacter sp. R2A 31.J]MBZ9557296.1 carboxymuconolactone decarboxylase family protein [Modicisalibacter sp. R2A 31.J]
MMEYAAPGDPSVLTHSKIAEDLKAIAPDVPRYMVEFAFGEIYTRPGLNKREQALVTIASLVTLGADPQVELHIHTGLTAGLSKEEVVAGIVHLLPYVGFPRVLNTLYIVKKVLAQRGVDTMEANSAK